MSPVKKKHANFLTNFISSNNFSEIPNVQSPVDSDASQSPVRPGSKTLQRDSFLQDEFPNFLLDEVSFDSGASGGLNYDEVDEIDTDNMAVYNDDDEINKKLAPLIKQEIIKQEIAKRSRQSKPAIIIQQQKDNQKRSSAVLSKLKQEPLEDLLIVNNAKKIKTQQPSPPPVNSINGENINNKSLLINSNNNIVNTQNNIELTEKNLPESLNFVQGNGKKLTDNDLISEFLIANSPQAMATNMNVIDQPTTSTGSNGKNLMYSKNDYMVPDAMPQAIFDENSQVRVVVCSTFEF